MDGRREDAERRGAVGGPWRRRNGGDLRRRMDAEARRRTEANQRGKAAIKRPRRWGCGAEDAEWEAADGRPRMQRAEEDPAHRAEGAEPRTGTPRHGFAMPRGFAAPGPAERNASEAPRLGGMPRRLGRESAAPAAAGGE